MMIQYLNDFEKTIPGCFALAGIFSYDMTKKYGPFILKNMTELGQTILAPRIKRLESYTDGHCGLTRLALFIGTACLLKFFDDFLLIKNFTKYLKEELTCINEKTFDNSMKTVYFSFVCYACTKNKIPSIHRLSKPLITAIAVVAINKITHWTTGWEPFNYNEKFEDHSKLVSKRVKTFWDVTIKQISQIVPSLLTFSALYLASLTFKKPPSKTSLVASTFSCAYVLNVRRQRSEHSE